LGKQRSTGNRESKVDKALAVAEGPALKGIERKRLLRVLSDLAEGEGSEGRAQNGQAEELAAERPFEARLGEDDEQLVTELRAGLAKLAGSRREKPVDAAAVQGALDGAEFVVRGDLLSGRGARIPQLLPSFVFLVLLPLLGKPEALRAAERAARLLDRG
jgi:hypothetical protein